MWTNETLIVVAAVVAVFSGLIWLGEHGRNWRGKRIPSDQLVLKDDAFGGVRYKEFDEPLDLDDY